MGLQTISYRTPESWNLVLPDIKDAMSLLTIKEK